MLESYPAPEVDHEREPSQAERDRGPQPAPHRLADEESGVERHEDRRDVFDHEGDADVEPAQPHEVEELDEGEAEDPEDHEEGELPPIRSQG